MVAAWAVPALVQTDGGFFTRGVMHHVVERSMRPFEGHGGFAPWWYLTYFATIPLTLLPWGVFLPWALPVLRAKPRPEVATFRVDERPLSDLAASRILLGWILGVVGVFTLVVSKLPHYVLPCFPALAIAIVLGRPNPGTRLVLVPRMLVVLGAVLALGLPIAVHFAGMTQATAPAAIAGVAIAVGYWLSARWFTRGYPRKALAGVACATCIGMATLFGRALPIASSQMLASRFGSELSATVGAGERVFLYHFVAPSVTYYLDAVTPEVKSVDEAMALLAEPGSLLLMRAHERNNLIAAARSLAPKDAALSARAEAALQQPLWAGSGFHPTKGKVVEMCLCGTRLPTSPGR